MPKKLKFDVVAAVKDASRTSIGALPLQRRIPNKRRRPATAKQAMKDFERSMK